MRVQGFASGARHCAEPNCQKPAWGNAPATRGRFNFEKHVRANHPPPLKKKAGAAATPTPRQQKQLHFTLPVPPPVAASSSSSAATPTSSSMATLATEGQDASAGETVRHPLPCSLPAHPLTTPHPPSRSLVQVDAAEVEATREEPSASSFQLVATSPEASAEAQDALWRSMVKVAPCAAAHVAVTTPEARPLAQGSPLGLGLGACARGCQREAAAALRGRAKVADFTAF